MFTILQIFWIVAIYYVQLGNGQATDFENLKEILIKDNELIEEFPFIKDLDKTTFPLKRFISENIKMVAIKCPFSDEKKKDEYKFKNLTQFQHGQIAYELTKGPNVYWYMIFHAHLKKSNYTFTCGYFNLSSSSAPIHWNIKFENSNNDKVFNEINLNSSDINVSNNFFNFNKERYFSMVQKENFQNFFEIKKDFSNLYKHFQFLLVIDSSDMKNNDYVEILKEIEIKKPYEHPSCISVGLRDSYYGGEYRDSIYYSNDDVIEECYVEKNEEDFNYFIRNNVNDLMHAEIQTSETAIHPNYHLYEDIKLSNLMVSNNGDIEIINERNLVINRLTGQSLLFLKKSQIFGLSYHCDYCVQGGLTIKKTILVGNKDFIENTYKLIHQTKYNKDELNYKPNCSLNFYALSIKSVSFNDEKVEIKDIKMNTGEQVKGFIGNGTEIIYTDKNPSGTITCIYKYKNETLSLSKSYEIIKNGQNSSNKNGTFFIFIFSIIFIIKMITIMT